MPPGGLRDVLDGVCARAGFRCDDLRLWETSSPRMLNAAVTGVLQRWRSIFLTVPLVRRLPRAPLEAVLAHEIAHVQRRHLWVYACLGGGFICWLLAVDFALTTISLNRSRSLSLRVNVMSRGIILSYFLVN